MKGKIIGILFILMSLVLFAYASNDKIIKTTSSSNLSNIYMEDDNSDENNYIVTLDLQGKGENQTLSIPKNTKIQSATSLTPVYSGYVFGGWYKEADCTNLWNFEEDTVTNNTTLYAKWTEEGNNSSSSEEVSSNTPEEESQTHVGELNKSLFDYIIANQENDNAIVKVERASTAQTGALTEYRYVGASVDNYVKFNDELWRIIGAFKVDNGAGVTENRVKLVKDSPIDGMELSWDSSASEINQGKGLNQWGQTVKSDDSVYNGADLMEILNTAYLNKTTGNCIKGLNEESSSCNFTKLGLDDNSREMIDDAKWYTGEPNGDTEKLVSTYFAERGDALVAIDGIVKTKDWTGKVGLLYPSDISSSSSECANDEAKTLANYNECSDSNWMYDAGNKIWTITPSRTNSYQAFYMDENGSIKTADTSTAYKIKPTVYLKSTVQVVEGAGTVDEPYELALSSIEKTEDDGDGINVPITDSTKSLIIYLISLILVLIGVGIMWYTQNKDKVQSFIAKLKK